MTREQAQKIADINAIKISTQCNAVYIGLLHQHFLFSYESKTKKSGGHCGCDIFAIVTQNGVWKQLTEDKDITSAIVFSSNQRRNP